jgi:hypothetical protein
MAAALFRLFRLFFAAASFYFVAAKEARCEAMKDQNKRRDLTFGKPCLRKKVR